jgi:hypothetical protein
MLIGLDFDNTIACYDLAIATLSDSIAGLPADTPRTKLGLRDHLRAVGRESDWTAFQGTLYGPGMCHAKPFDGAIATMRQLSREGHHLVIVSHRSLRPYAGPPYDLHAAARSWVAERLQGLGLFQESGAASPVNFLETRDAKIAMISKLKFDVFVDDLPEVLDAPDFPADTKGILFDPEGELPQRKGRFHLRDWGHLPALLKQMQ